MGVFKKSSLGTRILVLRLIKNVINFDVVVFLCRLNGFSYTSLARVSQTLEYLKISYWSGSVTFFYSLNGFSHTSLARVSQTLESLKSLYGIGSVAFLYSLNGFRSTSLARVSQALVIS